jgi:hypothetical protein
VTYYHNLASLNTAGKSSTIRVFVLVTTRSGQLSVAPATVMKTAVDRFSSTNTIGRLLDNALSKQRSSIYLAHLLSVFVFVS